MSRTITLSALALTCTLALPAMAQEKLKIGFIYVGPVGDFGWSYQHDQGRKAIEKAFPGRVETTFIENVPEADSERSIEQLARTGHKLIFTTSFGFMEPTLKVAKKYPDVKFEHATGFKRDKNVATYSAKFHEGRFIIGKIAGKLTKSNTIGYVGAMPIPEVIAGINAFYLGAKSVNPNVKIKIAWANTWFDPGKEGDAAKALMDQGADILTQHTDSPAPLQKAAERNIYAFGQASDMTLFAPKHILTSIIDDWAPYYVERTKAVLDGNWQSQDVFDGLAKGKVKMGAYMNMPEDVKKLAQETEAAIKAGTADPFMCPVIAQDGKTVECKGGNKLSDEQVVGMMFYVQGIEGTIPK
ncbi:MAG: BMP family ABC transporter substrate-binding protein [Proteobacteria bacterium]|nr:BMP family ABC transporter substrate-binding protein [Pseudomonadota bacterium]